MYSLYFVLATPKLLKEHTLKLHEISQQSFITIVKPCSQKCECQIWLSIWENGGYLPISPEYKLNIRTMLLSQTASIDSKFTIISG